MKKLLILLSILPVLIVSTHIFADTPCTENGTCLICVHNTNQYDQSEVFKYCLNGDENCYKVDLLSYHLFDKGKKAGNIIGVYRQHADGLWVLEVEETISANYTLESSYDSEDIKVSVKKGIENGCLS